MSRCAICSVCASCSTRTRTSAAGRGGRGRSWLSATISAARCGRASGEAGGDRPGQFAGEMLRDGLNTRPIHTPVNALRPASRPFAHDSGPPWLARPSLYSSFICSTSPDYPGAPTSIPHAPALPFPARLSVILDGEEGEGAPRDEALTGLLAMDGREDPPLGPRRKGRS
jgi:hypothetical protein